MIGSMIALQPIDNAARQQWLAGLVFAIHPMNITTVAWISKQENALSMLFCVEATLLYLRSDEESKKSLYVSSLVASLLGLHKLEQMPPFQNRAESFRVVALLEKTS
jgi:uncharacterized membrane protein